MVDRCVGCDILYLDHSNVFETVPHERLLRQVEAVVITGKILH